MNHVITLRDLVHWGLLAAAIISIPVVAYALLATLAAGMSDTPQPLSSWQIFGVDWRGWLLLGSPLIPPALFVAWWLT